MGICIFVKGASNKGKSSTIVELANLMGVEVNHTTRYCNGLEIRGVFVRNGIKVALCSQGDPGCNSTEWVIDKAIGLYKSDIVIVACRNGGKTQDPLLRFFDKLNFNIIEIRPFQLQKYNDKIEYKDMATALAMGILHLIDNYKSQKLQ